MKNKTYTIDAKYDLCGFELKSSATNANVVTTSPSAICG